MAGGLRKPWKFPSGSVVDVCFWKFVRKTETCWFWTGGLNGDGYGQLNLPHNCQVLAHVFSYELHFGKVPKGLCVCHECDNQPCINPEHLYPGTHKQNLQDAFSQRSRGRRKQQQQTTTEQLKQPNNTNHKKDKTTCQS